MTSNDFPMSNDPPPPSRRTRFCSLADREVFFGPIKPLLSSDRFPVEGHLLPHKNFRHQSFDNTHQRTPVKLFSSPHNQIVLLPAFKSPGYLLPTLYPLRWHCKVRSHVYTLYVSATGLLPLLHQATAADWTATGAPQTSGFHVAVTQAPVGGGAPSVQAPEEEPEEPLQPISGSSVFSRRTRSCIVTGQLEPVCSLHRCRRLFFLFNLEPPGGGWIWGRILGGVLYRPGSPPQF